MARRAMAPVCRYCIGIRAHAEGYRARPALHALRTSNPRCDWHWQFTCSKCGNLRSFHGIAFCDRSRQFFCIDCAPAHRAPRASFWGWEYYYRLRCPWRSEWHPALDRLEFEGRHPWQHDSSWRRTKRGMSTAEDLGERWSFRTEPIQAITPEISRKSWDAAATWWTSRSTARGDVNREWVIDPALFRLLGEVRGQRILDAGCGTGYLSRLLAGRGATVTGVDQSSKLLETARLTEANEPLGIDFQRADLAQLSPLRDGTFDLVVANVVMQDVVSLNRAFVEFHRVLRRGGRLVFSITHPCFERPVPGRWMREPADSERIEEWKGLLIDRYFERVAVWSAPTGQRAMVGFHRTLEDYATALHRAGFRITQMIEPTPSRQALKQKYREFADYARVPLFLIVEAIRASSESLGSRRKVVP